MDHNYRVYLGNRLERVRVLLVLAARPLGEPGGAAVAELLAESAPALLRPEALSEDASAALVRSAVPGAPPALCATCHQLTGGNPFFLHELTGREEPRTLRISSIILPCACRDRSTSRH